MTAFLSTLGLTFGFWLAAAMGTAAGVGLAWGWGRRRIARWHPADRASGLLFLACAPSLIPTGLILMLLAPGLAGLAVTGVDHCSSHPNHPHLCLAHPSAALPAFLAGVLLIGAGGLPLVARAAIRVWREQRRLGALSLVARRLPKPGVDVIESGLPFALTVGIARARTLVSSALLAALSPLQLEIVLAHEAEHARRRDPLRQLIARWLSVPLWPPLRRALLRELELSAEQACDDAAALRIEDRLVVADTILAVERLCKDSPRLAAPSMSGSSVGERVKLLLREPVRRRRRRWVLPGAAFALALALVLGVEPLHHEAEHLIAHLLGLQ